MYNFIMFILFFPPLVFQVSFGKVTTPNERRHAIPTLSIFDRVVILLEHLTRAAGECLGAVEVPMMDEIRTHHSVEFVQSFVNSREIPRTSVRGDFFFPS